MDTIEQELLLIIRELTMFNKIYNQYRIVDPEKKRVLMRSEGDLEVRESKCYDIWLNNKVCDNCISMRALNENETFIKMEYTEDKIYMVTAMPTEVKGRRFVIELLKNATNSMILEDIDLGRDVDVIKKINELNLIAITDELTGTYNKRYIFEKLPVEIMLHRLECKPLSILMIDVDHFKRINDAHGHMAGDCILKAFGGVLKETLRKEKDWVSRFGGEEFLICLPDTNKDKALHIAERIRTKVENRNFAYCDTSIALTVSIGVSTLDGETKDVEEFINYADRQLYGAKEKGRNCIEG